MNIQEALASLLEKHDLEHQQMIDVMTQIMTGEATPAQIGSFLTALRMKGETCLLYTSPSPRDQRGSRMPSSA